ncbi:MAG: RdgB/HAM1 family non-canonical purine NTP pyrophosphatase [Bacteroidota bacterium]|nr:RdgB/HAM1 family non-canonical purine NTP pyrophosphatase [Bacteroidota bacterium]
MITLIFATNNLNKVKEVKSLLNGQFEIQTLSEANIDIDIPEPYDTLEENAIQKAIVINRMTGKNCFAEDTGLQAIALNGEPGVKSARYAGEERSAEKNIDKLLFELKGKKDRSAIFKTVVCLVTDGKQILFEGTSKGTIIAERRGNAEFGYDPVFVPEGSIKTFAEMSLTEKNIFSHRKKAIEKLVEYLGKQ